MSANICPVIKLGEPKQIPGADKVEMFDVFGSGPCVAVKGQFKAGDLACFIPPETMVDTGMSCFAFMKHYARKSDGWAKVKPIRMRGQLSVGLLMNPDDVLGFDDAYDEGSNLAEQFKVKKPEDFDPAVIRAAANAKKVAPWYRRIWYRLTGTGPARIPNAPWPGIPVYDISQFYKMPTDMLSDDTLMVVTEKLHGTNARYCLDSKGKFRCGSRMRWIDDSKPFMSYYKDNNVWAKAALDADIERKMRRLAEPLVLWGEIVGPGIQKGFDYGVRTPTFFAFDFYHATERRFLSQSETYNLCRWLEIKHVPMLHVRKWGEIKDVMTGITPTKTVVAEVAHPAEGMVVRPYLMNGVANDLAGNKNMIAGKVINPLYYEYRDKNGLENEPPEEEAQPKEPHVTSVAGPF